MTRDATSLSFLRKKVLVSNFYSAKEFFKKLNVNY